MSHKIQKLCKSGIRYITDSDYRFLINANDTKYRKLSDREFIEKKFKASLGYSLNLSSPETFNEKLQWIKLYDRNPQYTVMVDKLLVRTYVKDKIGEDFLIPLISSWKDPEEINFDFLPNQFVLKCNHNSGLGMTICKDKSKINTQKVRLKLKKGLKQDYYLTGREWPYKDVPRRVICEKYIDEGTGESLKDYKFFCFNGIPKFFKIDIDRFTDHHANYYSTDGMLLPFGEADLPPIPDRIIELPPNIPYMLELAKKLSEGIPFVRVDFYNVYGKVFFGELTFFPASGFGKFIPESWDRRIGSYLKLPI